MVYNNFMAIEPSRPHRKIGLRGKLLLAFLLTLLFLTAVGVGIFFLSKNDALTRSVRDILLILVALEFFVVGTAMVVLIIQLSRLLLMLEMEIRPMLANATDTLNTLRGTSLFLGENLVAPVIKLSGSLAGVQRIMQVLGLFRKPQ